MTKEEYWKKLADCVFEMEDEEIVSLTQEYLDAGYDAFEAVNNGLVEGMNRAGEAFEEEEYFVTDLLLCSDAMYSSLQILNPHLAVDGKNLKKLGRCVIGVVEGDTHDIGKNLVKIMMETSGFEMIDLGRDVPIKDFVDKAEQENADIICLSTLMTTTMNGMKEVVQELNARGIRDRVKVMIGGGPVSQGFAKEIGADGYSSNAKEAIELAKSFMVQHV